MQKCSNIDAFETFGNALKGSECHIFIAELLENDSLLNMHDILDLPFIQALQNDEEKEGKGAMENNDRNYFQLLKIFCDGNYDDYMVHKDTLPSLNDKQEKKLRKLTILSLLQRCNEITYDVLAEKIHIGKDRGKLEMLLIELIYAGLIKGKLNQRKQCFEVEEIITRTTPSLDVSSMIDVLEEWKTRIDWAQKELQDKEADTCGSRESNDIVGEE